MEAELLKKILIKISSPKLTSQLLVSSNKTDFDTKFSPPLELDKEKYYEIALVNLETYYSFPNIENNIFDYYNGKERKQFEIPTGSYEIESLNDYIQRQIGILGDDKEAIEISPNLNTLKTMISVKRNYKVFFTNKKSLRKLLGFRNNRTIESGYHESDHIINILSVNTILIHLDIITGSTVNGSPTSVIYAFFPNVSPGYKIVERPHNLTYLPVVVKTIKSLNVRITDQDGNQLKLRGETVTIKFHMREC